MSDRITVIGAGAWGTTMASLLATKGPVNLWAREPEVVADVNDRHRNQRFLPDVPLPSTLTATSDLAVALEGADAVLVAVPSQFLREVLGRGAASIAPDIPLLTLTKGIEVGTLLRMSEVAAEVLADHRRELIGVLSGPNIARQVAVGEPAATVVAMADRQAAERLQEALGTPSLRIYTNPDVVGCEIGGSVKNVIALAAGMAVGLGYSDNTMAAVVTRGLAELTRFGVALGGQPLTFLGLAGMGDLVVTCHSSASRNHRVGVELGRGRTLPDILADMSAVAEGVRSCAPVLALADRVGVDLPICRAVGEVLAERLQARQIVDLLLAREATAEMHDIAEP